MDAAASTGGGDGDDERGLEEVICEDAGVRNFLEEFMGAEGFEGFDDDFLEEFRKSDSFVEILREVGLENSVGSSGQSTASRRPSLTELDRGTVRSNSAASQRAVNTGIIHPDPPQKEVTPPPVASRQSPSTSRQSQGSKSPEKKSKKKKKTKDERRRTAMVVLSDSQSSLDSDGDERGSQFTRKLSDKLKIRPIPSTSTAATSKKDKRDNIRKKPSQPPHERTLSQDSSTKKKLELELKSKKKQDEEDDEEFDKFFRRSIGKLPDPGLIYLVDLLAMTSLFPIGLQERIKVTPRLLHEIAECEQKIRMTKSISQKKCVRVSRDESSKDKSTISQQVCKGAWALRQQQQVKDDRQVPKPKTPSSTVTTDKPEKPSYKDIVKGSLKGTEDYHASEDNQKKKEAAAKKEKAHARSDSLTPDKRLQKSISLAPEKVSKKSSSLAPEKSPKKSASSISEKGQQQSSSLANEKSPVKSAPLIPEKSPQKSVPLTPEKVSKKSSLAPEKSPKKFASSISEKGQQQSSSLANEKSPVKSAPLIPENSPQKSVPLTPEKVSKKSSSFAPEKSPKKSSSFGPEKSPKKSASVTPEKGPQQSAPVAPEKSPVKSAPLIPEKSSQKYISLSPEKVSKKSASFAPEKGPKKSTPLIPEKSPEKSTLLIPEKTLQKTISFTPENSPTKSTSTTPEKSQKNNATLEDGTKATEMTSASPKKKPNPFGVLSFATLNEKLNKVRNEPLEKSKQEESSSASCIDKDEGATKVKEHVILIKVGQKTMPLSESTSDINRNVETETSSSKKDTSNETLREEVGSGNRSMSPALIAPPQQLPEKHDLGPRPKELGMSRSPSPSKKKTDEIVVLDEFDAKTETHSQLVQKEKEGEAIESTIPVIVTDANTSLESELVDVEQLSQEGDEQIMGSKPPPEVEIDMLLVKEESIVKPDEKSEKILSTPGTLPDERTAQVEQVNDLSISLPHPPLASPEKEVTSINVEIDENLLSDHIVDLDTEMPSPPPSHPGDDSQEPSSPEITEIKKLSSPDRVMPKKKNVIESSSDDGDNRKEETDITDCDDHDSPPDDGKNKSSDDEQMGSKKSVRFAHNPSIQRERDQDHDRSGKFGEFEMERQRKKEKKRGSKLSKEKTDLLEEIMKDTQLTGSFRIPRKTTSNKRTDSIAVSTPLTIVAAEVSKENLTFERFRKGLSDKDKLEKKEKGDWNNKNRGGLGDWNTKNLREDEGDSTSNNNFKEGNNRMNREPGAFDKFKLRDEGRMVLLAPEDGKLGSGGGGSTPGGGRREPPPEENWEDDGPTGGDSPDMGGSDNENVDVKDDNEVGTKDDEGKNKEDNDNNKRKEDNQKKDGASTDKHSVDLQRIKVEHIKTEKVAKTTTGADSTKITDEEVILLNPEVAIKTIEVNPFSVGAMMLLNQDPNPQLPDLDEEKNLAESTMIKLAWWISKADFDNSREPGSEKDWYKVHHDGGDDGDGSASEGSYLERLECSLSEDDEILHSLPKEIQRRSIGPVDEYCGRQLLEAKYRSGPDDKFSHIFQTRGGVTDKSYLRENFQTRCTLCDQLVVGKTQLANHVVGDYHREKMSQAGVNDVQTAESSTADKTKDKNVDVKKSVADSTSSEEKDKGGERKDKDQKKDEDKHKRKDKKRKRSKSKEGSTSDKSGAEVGVTSTGLPIKIPAGAIPDKSKDKDSKRPSDSRDKRSRSRSPRNKRNRSQSRERDKDRSRKSRSRSPPGSSRRRRSRSRERDRVERNRARDREPVVRISRSPTKLRESRTRAEPCRARSRSTSAERVQKFLARTQRRSRSPSNGYRKRHRHGSPPKDLDVLPKKTNREFHEKLMLTADGKWNDELESKWKVMEVEEAIFMEQFGEKSKALKTTPESHPEYPKEWSAFWERRYQEIEDEGKEDPDKHNYVPEWKDFWNKRVRDILNKEYEDAINAIKVRNGVDIESLQRIRNTIKEPIIMQRLPDPHLINKIPQPVPPPSNLHMVMGGPPPQILMTQVPSIQGTITPSSRSVSDIGEDMTARSMSISDGGDVRTTAKPAAPSPAVTTVDIMSTWEKLTTGGGVPSSRHGSSSNSAAPPPPAKQPLRSLSISKSVDERSVVDSSASIESYTFTCGMDVAQVLRIMTNLEDQLSFFAPKVQEYFTKAEELDLKQRNKSYSLLTDEDFVAMMFQIRDRFMAQIRAHILPRSILDQLNLAAYGLNGILDHPECQKRRPKHVEIEKPPPETPVTPVQLVETPAPAQPKPSTTSSNVNVNDTFTRPASKSHQQNPARNLSEAKKKEVSVLLTHFLLIMGRDDVSDGELKQLIARVCTQQATSASNSARNSASSTPQNRRGGQDSDSSLRTTTTRFGETSNSDPWRPPDRNVTKLYSVASVQGAGTAMPELSTIIPPSYQNPSSGGGTSGPMRFGSSGGDGGGVRGGSGFGRGGRGYGHEGAGDNYMSSASTMDGSHSGRHSPFSQRDFTGNPAYSNNSYYDKIARASSTTSASAYAENRGRPSTNTKENNPEKMIDGMNMPMVTVGTTSLLTQVKRTLSHVMREPEIQMSQLSKYKDTKQASRTTLKDHGHVGRETKKPYQLKISNLDYDPGGIESSSSRRPSCDIEVRSAENEIAYHIRKVGISSGVDGGNESSSSRRMSREGEIVLDESQHNLPKLPPGIMNMIIRERNMKAKQALVEVGEVLSDVLQGEDGSHYYRRKRKRRRKKMKGKARNSSSSSSSDDDDDSDGSKHARNRSRERRRRREKRKKTSRKESESLSDNSVFGEEISKRGQSRSLSTDGRRKSSGKRQSSRSYDYEDRSRHSSNRKSSRRGKRESYTPSPTREKDVRRESSSRSSSRWRSQRHPSCSKRVNLQGGTDRLPRMAAPAPLHESDWENPSENERKENSQESVSLSGNQIKIAPPPPTNELSDGELEILECTPLQDNKPLLRESNLNPERNISRRHVQEYGMFAYSPPASMNSGSSGYRRTRERRNVTTINVPGSKTLPRSDWEELSDASSLGENKRRSGKEIPTNQGHSNENIIYHPKRDALKSRPEVTSVSKTFWTAGDEDDKSLSSVSSYDIRSTPDKQPSSALKQQSSNPVVKMSASKPLSTTVKSTTVGSLPVPDTTVVESRKYRARCDADKEPGELSTCSSNESFD